MTTADASMKKKGRGTDSGKIKGFSTGGSYASPATIIVANSLIALQQEMDSPPATTEAGQTFLKTLLVFSSEEEVLDLLLYELLQIAAWHTFPQEAEAIVQLYEFSLRIAWFRQQRQATSKEYRPLNRRRLRYALLRPQENVRDKLLTDDIPELYRAIARLQTMSSPTPKQRQTLQAQISLRLANVLYYAVQLLVHDLWKSISQVANQGYSPNQFFTACQQAMATFTELVQKYCTEAQKTPAQGFSKAVLKFALRATSNQQFPEAELLLMQE